MFFNVSREKLGNVEKYGKACIGMRPPARASVVTIQKGELFFFGDSVVNEYMYS